MTEVQEELDTGPVGRRRREGQDGLQIVDRELAERLVAHAREAGVDLVGPDGLLR